MNLNSYYIDGERYLSERISYPNISIEDLENSYNNTSIIAVRKMTSEQLVNNLNRKSINVFSNIDVFYCETFPSLSVLKRNINFGMESFIPLFIVVEVYLYLLRSLHSETKKNNNRY